MLRERRRKHDDAHRPLRGKGKRANLKSTLKKSGDPLRNNPVVGMMTEAQAERILAEMRDEESRGIY